MMNVEQSVEWELSGEIEVLGENLPQCHFIHYKSHMTWPGLETGLPLWEAGDLPCECLGIVASFLLIPCVAYSSALKVELICPHRNVGDFPKYAVL
jgi:hypothetical protein